VVAVFQYVTGFVHAPGAEVDGYIAFRADGLRPSHKFVYAYFVGFRGFPRQVKTLGAAFLWPDAVLPVVARNEIAARVTDEGDV
jgi:hypothetical protein